MGRNLQKMFTERLNTISHEELKEESEAILGMFNLSNNESEKDFYELIRQCPQYISRYRSIIPSPVINSVINPDIKTVKRSTRKLKTMPVNYKQQLQAFWTD